MPSVLRRFLPVKTVILAALMIVLAVWLVRGLSVIRGLGGSDSTERFVAEQADRLRQIPEADAILARMKEKHEIRALAASVHAAYESEGNSGLRRLVAQIRSGTDPCGMALARLAVREGRFQVEADREAFVVAHATACEALTGAAGGAGSDQYLTLLAEVEQQPAVWRVVREDPVALVLWPVIGSDAALWSFYVEQRDWLAEALVELKAARAVSIAASENDGRATQSAQEQDEGSGFAVDKAIAAAYLYHPLARQAVVNEGLGGVGLSLFLDHGAVLQEAVAQHGLPLNETMEVLFTNGESFLLEADSKPALQERIRQTAAELAHIHRSKPSVWTNAKQHPLALRLNRDVPQYADELLEKYGVDDIGMFLYASFENEIAPAAAAVAKFGDLGIYILNRYADDERLHQWLRDPRVGVRIIPFLARFQDAGLDRVDERLDWLNRYFELDGSPKEDDYAWLQGVPLIGGPANVIRHWSRGEPCEWSELGWAALDVADTALLVMSFGGSSALTAAKSGAKTTAARQFVRGSGRGAARAAQLGARQAARKAVKVSALRRLVQAGSRSALWVRRVSRGAGNAVARTWEAAKAAKTAWRSVPLRIRLWTYRGLLAVGLFVTLKERTLPKLPEMGKAFGEFAGRAARQGSEAAGTALAAAVKEMFASGRGPLRPWAQFLLYGVVSVMLLTSTLAYLRRHFRPQVHAVR